MKRSLIIAAIMAGLCFAPSVAGAQQRLRDGVIGGVGGALVGGPVGAVVGGVGGYVEGPRIERAFSGRRHYRHARYSHRRAHRRHYR